MSLKYFIFIYLFFISPQHLLGNGTNDNEAKLKNLLRSLASISPFADINDLKSIDLYIDDLSYHENLVLKSTIGVDKSYIYNLSKETVESYQELYNQIEKNKIILSIELNKIFEVVSQFQIENKLSNINHLDSDEFSNMIIDVKFDRNDFTNINYFLGLHSKLFSRRNFQDIYGKTLEKTYIFYIVGIAISCISMSQKISNYQFNMNISDVFNDHFVIDQTKYDLLIRSIADYLKVSHSNAFNYNYLKYQHFNKISDVEKEFELNYFNLQGLDFRLYQKIITMLNDLKRSRIILIINFTTIVLRPHRVFCNHATYTTVNCFLFLNFVITLAKHRVHFNKFEHLKELREKSIKEKYKLDDSLNLIFLFKNIGEALFL